MPLSGTVPQVALSVVSLIELCVPLWPLLLYRLLCSLWYYPFPYLLSNSYCNILSKKDESLVACLLCSVSCNEGWMEEGQGWWRYWASLSVLPVTRTTPFQCIPGHCIDYLSINGCVSQKNEYIHNYFSQLVDLLLMKKRIHNEIWWWVVNYFHKIPSKIPSKFRCTHKESTKWVINFSNYCLRITLTEIRGKHLGGLHCRPQSRSLAILHCSNPATPHLSNLYVSRS
jgi:hypothetical protein